LAGEFHSKSFSLLARISAIIYPRKVNHSKQMSQPRSSDFSDHAASFQPCGLPRRLMVMLYDLVVVTGLLMLAAGLAIILQTGNQVAGKDLLYTLYLLTIWFLYLTWCWRNGGMTLGMRAWQVQLIPDQGIHPGWVQCAIRFFGSWVSAALLGAGFIWCLWGEDKKAWHDYWSNSRLVKLNQPKD
jgi:uncharacterized RDD family membrane protein YckC